MEIKDSGNRREFETGALRDMAEGKGRMDLLPWAAIMEVSKHSQNGAKKYGEHNVDKGLNTSSFADSGARHLAKWMDGWTDEPHLLAAAWNLLWAIQMELKHPELCDVPWDGNKAEDKKRIPASIASLQSEELGVTLCVRSTKTGPKKSLSVRRKYQRRRKASILTRECIKSENRV